MNIQHLLTDTITYKLKTGVGTYGDPSFGSALTTKARVEFTSKTYVDPSGNEKYSQHVLTTTVELPRGTRLWVPGASTSNDNEALEVKQIKKANIPGGDYLYEVYT